MLIVMGYVHVAPDDVGAFLSGIGALAWSAADRDGCLFYTVAPEDPSTGRMLVAERWRDDAALSAHLRSPDTVAFVQRWDGRMRGEVETFDAGNGRALTD